MKKLLIAALLCLSACSWSGSFEAGQIEEYQGKKFNIVSKSHNLESYSYIILVSGLKTPFLVTEYSDGTLKAEMIPIPLTEEDNN